MGSVTAEATLPAPGFSPASYRSPRPGKGSRGEAKALLSWGVSSAPETDARALPSVLLGHTRGPPAGGAVCGARTRALGGRPPSPQTPGWTSEPVHAPEPTLEPFSARTPSDSSSHKNSTSVEGKRAAQRGNSNPPSELRKMLTAHMGPTPACPGCARRRGAFPVLQTSCPDEQSVWPLLALGGVSLTWETPFSLSTVPRLGCPSLGLAKTRFPNPLL